MASFPFRPTSDSAHDELYSTGMKPSYFAWNATAFLFRVPGLTSSFPGRLVL